MQQWYPPNTDNDSTLARITMIIVIMMIFDNDATDFNTNDHNNTLTVINKNDNIH